MSLPRLDFSTLSHNAAKWPLPGKALLGCALAGLVVLVGDVVLLAPARERLQALEAQEVILQQAHAQNAGKVAGFEGLTRQAQVTEDQVAGLLRQLPGESDMPGLLEDIARLAVANGLVVEDVTVLDEQPHPFYIEEPVQVGVFGAYHDLAMFVSGLGGLPRIVTAHDVVLRPDGSLLRLDLLAKSYRSASGHGKPAQAVEQGARFVYAAASLRDPFQPLALQVGHVSGRPARAPDLARKRGALEGLAIDRFEMVGTLSRGLQTFVLLRAASTVHRLAVGDYLGPHHGRVTAIHDSYIELAELFPDEQGAWLERSRTLVLNVNS
ncbi:pilus assembly protein [Pseudomonas sp. IB20]|uniref:pilus assembly protein PilP n=1 Tax=Pseudomonas TaxID=286 RepID=UPI000BA10D3B|nr:MULTISPECIES: pilus assembly protein PilP [unclassified Pseudomonas]MCV2228471.1 pilus assembly protein PilP [Pseudomonas sp. AU10]OZO05897.1 pilus assembly protein [Pseudomonas sp. IB20]